MSPATGDGTGSLKHALGWRATLAVMLLVCCPLHAVCQSRRTTRALLERARLLEERINLVEDKIDLLEGEVLRLIQLVRDMHSRFPSVGSSSSAVARLQDQIVELKRKIRGLKRVTEDLRAKRGRTASTRSSQPGYASRPRPPARPRPTPVTGNLWVNASRVARVQLPSGLGPLLVGRRYRIYDPHSRRYCGTIQIRSYVNRYNAIGVVSNWAAPNRYPKQTPAFFVKAE